MQEYFVKTNFIHLFEIFYWVILVLNLLLGNLSVLSVFLWFTEKSDFTGRGSQKTKKKLGQFLDLRWGGVFEGG